MIIQSGNTETDDRFTWKEDDLEIEDPIGSGQFIPLREFNRRIAAEEARETSEKAAHEKYANQGKPGAEKKLRPETPES